MSDRVYLTEANFMAAMHAIRAAVRGLRDENGLLIGAEPRDDSDTVLAHSLKLAISHAYGEAALVVVKQHPWPQGNHAKALECS